MSEWISVDDRLPDVDFGYFLTVRYYHQDPSLKSVQQSFYIKDREYARGQRRFYSRKTQGKNSVHFDCAESGFVVSHWMPLPEPPKDL